MSERSAREIIAYLDRIEPMLDQLSHFELLEVAPGADGRGVREAFYRKASTLHPDLHRQTLTLDDHERLTAVYARIALAYLVLREPGAREAHARAGSGDGVRAAEQALPLKARRLYQRAQAALDTGDHAGAVLNLRMAVAAAPASALLRQALAQVLDQLSTRK